ncbi:MAG: hypothetical protein L0Z62_33270 [Gemmataceae bacterium]|nr:hypothetical protein [Gemmataceae bacterium]
MSSSHDVKGLINLGRKAGLRTSDLYPALATRPPEGSENGHGQADGNGFVADYDQDGRLVYRPVEETDKRQGSAHG